MNKICKFCAYFTAGRCTFTYEPVKPHTRGCEEFETVLSCPDCEIKPQLHTAHNHAVHWYECPRCFRRTDEYNSGYSAASAWMKGNTYMPERYENEFEDIRS